MSQRASLLAAFKDLESDRVVVDASPLSPEEGEGRDGEAKESEPRDLSGFIMLNGCYEGDPYEPLGVKVVDYGLQIFIERADEVINFLSPLLSLLSSFVHLVYLIGH